MSKPKQRLLAAILVPVEVVIAALAWRDLARRSDDRVRGKKNVWRAIMLVNPGNSMFYWALGRR